MLQELVNAFSGSLETTAYTLPQANGMNVTPKETFKNFFNNFVASLKNSPGNTFLPMNSNNFNGVQPGAVNSYQNFQGGFTGQFPVKVTSHVKTISRRNLKAFSPGPYKPGATVIYLADSQPVQDITSFPQTNISPVQALVGAGNAGLGLQGYTSQFGSGQIAPAIGNSPPFSGLTPLQGSSGSGGIITTLIMPLFSLIGLLSSLLQVRKITGVLKPAKVNRDNLDYMQYQKYLADTEETQEGSFDNYDPYIREEGQELISDDYASEFPLNKFEQVNSL